MDAEHPAVMPKIIAHRGASANAPENTLAAIDLAAELGAGAIEVDAQITRDGVAVLFHDETLERTTNGEGFLVQHDWADLAELDAGSWFTNDHHGERIPRLADALDHFHTHDLLVNLEIKAILGWEVPTAEAVAACVIENWHRARPLLVSSMYPLVLETFQKAIEATDHCEHTAYAWVSCAVPDDWRQRMEAVKAEALHCHHAFITPARVADLHARGKRVHVHTVNDRDRGRELFDMGVDAIFTDDVGRMAAIVQED